MGDVSTIDIDRQVILIRGFQDWYSTGIDRLRDELRANGLEAQVFRDDQYKNAGDALVRYRQREIVLVGFSYGADDVIMIAEHLAQHHQNVKLLITIDPVTPDPVPENVQTCTNFYQSNGFWDIFPWLRGVPLEKQAGSCGSVENINIRRRLDLLEPDTSHATIAANEKVHREIIKLILASK
jgi:pimeloyl-ACP methyl ester carboxylesterase